MLNQEKRIKEERTALAVSKNYMGLDGKFGVILKYLGKPVVTQGLGNHEVTEWQDMYALHDEDELPFLDEHESIKEIGKLFDGLKFGYHIEIKYLQDGTVPITVTDAIDPRIQTTFNGKAQKVLSVYFKGYPVYIEVEGDLITFVPSNEWEDIVANIYRSAEKLQKSYKQDKTEETIIETKREKLNWLQQLRERWGI
jgi:hypothetical protein